MMVNWGEKQKRKKQHPEFMCFSANTDEAEARRMFREKYGKEPKRVFVAYGLLKCGPIGEEDEIR